MTAMRREQRRMAVAALIACAWMLGVALVGAVDALGYLAPTLALLALLALGRYPGERAYVRRLARPRRARRRRPPPAFSHRLVRARLPRGGALLGAALAVRGPPPLAG
jgi:hypothetical protein